MWYDTHGDSVACGLILRLKQLLYHGDVLNLSVNMHLLIMVSVPVMIIAIVSGRSFVKLGRDSGGKKTRPDLLGISPRVVLIFLMSTASACQRMQVRVQDNFNADDTIPGEFDDTDMPDSLGDAEVNDPKGGT